MYLEQTMRAISRQCKLVAKAAEREDTEDFQVLVRGLIEELEYRLDNSYFNCQCGRDKSERFYKMAVDIAS
jgi:hypothetical protein